MRPLILTLALPPDAFAFFDRLRQDHFPPERNHLPAHVTLFHHLPGEEERAVRDALADEAAGQAPVAVRVEAPRFIGRGVAYDLAAPDLARLRGRLARRFDAHLTPQDRQGYRPHVTVQNKVEPVRARALHAALAAEFSPRRFEAPGLLLWRYLGGPWERLAEIPFEAPA